MDKPLKLLNEYLSEIVTKLSTNKLDHPTKTSFTAMLKSIKKEQQ